MRAAGTFPLHTGLFQEMLPHALIPSRIRAYTEGMTTNNTTPIQMLADAMTGYTTAQLLDIVAELANSSETNERLVKYAAYEVIEGRNPEVVAILEAWCDDVTDARDYSTMLADALATLPAVK